MPSKMKIKPFSGPAGGWSSLATSVRHLLQAGNPAPSAKALITVNQPEGFDCPGCAWGDPNHMSSFEFCENGLKAVASEATSKRCGPSIFAKHSVAWLAEQDECTLESFGRLTHPMRYDSASDHYQPVSWDDAFAVIGRELTALKDPDEAVFYTSGRTSNEAAFLWQLFVREFGTNNLPDCSNMCHEASGVALMDSIGIGKGTVLLEDIKLADAIFIFGQNPGTNHPRMLGDLREAAARGARIVAVNPLKERGLERFAHPKSFKDMVLGGENIAHLYLQPQVGGDHAFLKGMMKRILEAEDNAKSSGKDSILDRDFIASQTDSFEALAADLRRESWDRICAQSGLTQTEIARAADIYMTSDRVICTWAMGLTQHRDAVETIQNIINLLLLRGNLGRPGTGPCPVRGHSNVSVITVFGTEVWLN
jgi:molybdopterin-dependent oxidoreductase alpha subunit